MAPVCFVIRSGVKRCKRRVRVGGESVDGQREKGLREKEKETEGGQISRMEEEERGREEEGKTRLESN